MLPFSRLRIDVKNMYNKTSIREFTCLHSHMIRVIQHESYVLQFCSFVLMAEFEEFVDHDLSNKTRRNLKYSSAYCREGD